MLTSGEGFVPQGAEGPKPPGEPFTFTVEGPPTYEDVRPPTASPRENAPATAFETSTGEQVDLPEHQRNVVVPGRQRQIGTGVAPRVESFPTEATGDSGAAHSTRTTPEWWAPGSGAEGPLGKPQFDPKAPSGVRKVPIYQYLTDIRPGSEPIPLDKGGGTLITRDPEVAQNTLSRLKDLLESDMVKPEDRAAIQHAHDSLAEQLDLFHAYDNEGRDMAGAHFPQVDPRYAAKDVTTFGDAADMVQRPATPVYQRLDFLSNKEFSKASQQIKRGQAILRKQGLEMDAYDRAEESIKEATDTINTIFGKFRGKIAPSDWKAASNAWRDGKVLEDIHTAVERAFNADAAPAEPSRKHQLVRR
jgi:hypothetical protein